MQRFIRYLYEYEQGKRIRNVGFVKVETGNEETIVHMQGKGFHNSGDRKLKLYLFYEENEEIIGIWQTEMCLATPVLSYSFQFSRNIVNGLTGEAIDGKYEKIAGIILEAENGRRIAATWDDMPVDVSSVDMARVNMLAGRQEEKAGRSTPEVENVRPLKAIAGRQEEKAGRSTPEETKGAREERNAALEDKDISLQNRKITKILRKDISRLPHCEWKLANNQFLMHGYNNYHHLLLIEKGNDLKLGVPGIYHIEEAKVAEKFGFEEFLSVEEIDLTLREDERHQSEPFGYWCRPVKKCYHNIK